MRRLLIMILAAGTQALAASAVIKDSSGANPTIFVKVLEFSHICHI